MFVGFMKWCKSDWVKGLVVSSGTGLLVTIYPFVEKGTVTWDNVKAAIMAATAAGIVYMLKQLGTDATGKFLGKV